MKKSVLYYTWHENSESDMVTAMLEEGLKVVKCHIPIRNYDEDAEFREAIKEIITTQDCDVIFSFNFFPEIARTAEELQIKYISWIYDSPNLTLFSPAIRCKNNYIYIFDKDLYLRIKALNISNVYHLPLAVNT